MPEIISLREYARRKGVSLPAVQKAAANGRIEVIAGATGRIKGIDWETQEAAWESNSKAPQRRPHNPGGGRPRKDGQPPAAPKGRATTKTKDPEPDPEDQSEEPADKPGGMSLAQIQRARELVKLQIDNLKLQEAKGELVRVDVVRSEYARLGSVVKSSLSNIPDRIASQLAGMTAAHEIHSLLTREINQAIEALQKEVV